MARLFYSVMGGGRGHASRALAVCEQLAQQHDVVLFASHDAYDFLRTSLPADGRIELHRIPGLRFHYRRGRIDLVRTVIAGLAFRGRLNRMLAALAPHFAAHRPELVIVDFEPLLPRAARRFGVPYVSLDHQHFLRYFDLSDLPRGLRYYAAAMSLVVRLMHRWQAATIVTAFYRPPLRSEAQDVWPIGPILRHRVRRAMPTRGEHLVSYLRPKTPPRVVEALRQCGHPVRVYGLGQRANQGEVTFHAVDERAFVDHLASAKALVSAAGNQLFGEALYLGKPVLALPEAHHHEQQINAHYLRQMRAGDFVPLEQFSPQAIQAFLDRLPDYEERLAAFRHVLDGTSQAVQLIEQQLRPRAVAAQRFAPEPVAAG